VFFQKLGGVSRALPAKARLKEEPPVCQEGSRRKTVYEKREDPGGKSAGPEDSSTSRMGTKDAATLQGRKHHFVAKNKDQII